MLAVYNIQFHKLCANYCLGIIYTYFNKEREVHSILFSTTPVKLKHVFVVRTAYDHKQVRLSSLQVTSLNDICCEDRCKAL